MQVSIKAAAEYFDKGQDKFPEHMSIQKAADVRKAIEQIVSSKETPKLLGIR
jgi:hypothetical protein